MGDGAIEDGTSGGVNAAAIVFAEAGVDNRVAGGAVIKQTDTAAAIVGVAVADSKSLPCGGVD